jgi:hypothetical protein
MVDDQFWLDGNKRQMMLASRRARPRIRTTFCIEDGPPTLALMLLSHK